MKTILGSFVEAALTVVYGFALACIATLLWFSLGCSRGASASSGCVAGPDEKCPSDLYFKEKAQMKALEEKYKPPVVPEEDRIKYLGLSALVNGIEQQPPTGFHWDMAKVRYVKNPAPAPTGPVTPNK